MSDDAKHPAAAVAPPRKRRGLRLSMFPTMLTL